MSCIHPGRHPVEWFSTRVCMCYASPVHHYSQEYGFRLSLQLIVSFMDTVPEKEGKKKKFQSRPKHSRSSLSRACSIWRCYLCFMRVDGTVGCCSVQLSLARIARDETARFATTLPVGFALGDYDESVNFTVNDCVSWVYGYNTKSSQASSCVHARKTQPAHIGTALCRRVEPEVSISPDQEQST